MYSLLIIFMFTNNTNVTMVAKSKPFESLEMCQNEEKVMIDLKNRGGSIMENTKILTTRCEKLIIKLDK